MEGQDDEAKHLTREATCHVDDNALSGTAQSLELPRKLLESRFGNMARQTPPFVHVGIHYVRNTSSWGLRIIPVNTITPWP